mmetsp:Transcript_20062/g.30840  ORF Transcript_20062/g.30840 Transcript_20062/m.30840 type:complete len:99 (+) Transcript_20062:1125-1421(+)
MEGRIDKQSTVGKVSESHPKQGESLEEVKVEPAQMFIHPKQSNDKLMPTDPRDSAKFGGELTTGDKILSTFNPGVPPIDEVDKDESGQDKAPADTFAG